MDSTVSSSSAPRFASRFVRPGAAPVQISATRFLATCLATLGSLFLRFPELEEFKRGEISKRLVRAHGVINVFPATERRIGLRDVPALWDRLIALFVRSAGYPSPMYLHGDTLSSATYHSEREHERQATGWPFGTVSVGSQVGPTATICHKCLRVNQFI